MNIDKVLQATLLLTVFFNKREVRNFKPLTPTEYGRFAAWLHQQGLSPADLLNDAGEVLKTWVDPKNKITVERLIELLARGASMGFALEQWQKHGVWMLSRSSNEYPRTIRKHLGDARPPILFGIGNKSLLYRPGIGFVGSRSIEDADADLTKKLACLAVDQGYSVISGGAKGIDQTAMNAALNHGGLSVGVLADSLLKTSTLRIYREAIQNDQLVLTTPYYPEAGFSTGNAMGRNKYIYTLSQGVVAVKSDFEKGGTWTGAIENLKKGWVPLLVPNTDNTGNRQLIKQGAIPIDDSFDNFQEAIENSVHYTDAALKSSKNVAIESNLSSTSNPGDLSLQIDEPATDAELGDTEHENVSPLSERVSRQEVDVEPQPQIVSKQPISLVGTPLEQYGKVFEVFLAALIDIANRKRHVSPDDLQEVFPELSANIIKKWLAELDEHRLLIRESRKLSYTLPDPGLFE